MTRKTARGIFFLVCLALIAPTGVAQAQKPVKESAAVAAAEAWLGRVDRGEYAESWTDAAEYFRNAVPRDQWVQSLKAVRSPLGKLISRKVKSRTYKTSVPGAPDGEYVVIQFDTSFAEKKSAVETITPVLEKDGKWRVSGYFIK